MPPKKKPHGRDQVIEALLEAAADLFSKRGVKAVSMREIAILAQVNYGLIHRHFGSKDILRRKTQEYLADKLKAHLSVPTDFHDAMMQINNGLQKDSRMMNILARSLLEGTVEGSVQDSFPNMQYLVQFVKEEQKNGVLKPDLDARFIVAGIVAMGFGLTLFEDFLAPATNLDKEPEIKLTLDVFNMWLSQIQAENES